ncbi:MAG: hypothetical protein WC705_01160 [Candidatus Paceibacterota bacterium]|jgi:hypothetical protein
MKRNLCLVFTLVIVLCGAAIVSAQPLELVANGGVQTITNNDAPMLVDISLVGKPMDVDQLPTELKTAMAVDNKMMVSTMSTTPEPAYPQASGVLVALAMPLSDSGQVRAFYLGTPGANSYVAGRMCSGGQCVDITSWYVQQDCRGCSIFMDLNNGPLPGQMRQREVIFDVFVFRGTSISKISGSVVVDNNRPPSIGPSIGAPWINGAGELVVPGNFENPTIGVGFWFLESEFTINRTDPSLVISLPCGGNYQQVVTVCDHGECGTVSAPTARHTATAISMPGQG